MEWMVILGFEIIVDSSSVKLVNYVLCCVKF